LAITNAPHLIPDTTLKVAAYYTLCRRHLARPAVY
jgi:hypothetical protein